MTLLRRHRATNVIPPRLNVVTLGVQDLPTMRRFYEALGWRSHSIGDEFARFDIGGAVLALYPVELLAEEAYQLARPADGRFRGFTLAVVVSDPADVDANIDLVEGAGGRVLAHPVDRDWGGRSGYFADPEGNVWELAWLPPAEFDGRGTLIWPLPGGED